MAAWLGAPSTRSGQAFAEALSHLPLEEIALLRNARKDILVGRLSLRKSKFFARMGKDLK